ncbi:MAG TPA: DNA polymerase IV, partial [Chloroflexota bacterium]|nr:DNA polymerase IV [Chloroflexota bacterium]
MIIHILIPHFWIVVEELRRPDLLARPVIIGDGFMEKRGGHVKVLMANAQAESFGVRSGITLAHARQLCPEAVILSPELPLYAGVWDDVMALLLTYTPLVESLGPGEAVCDVTGCERLFGAPVPLAQEITRQIECSAGLPARAGV